MRWLFLFFFLISIQTFAQRKKRRDEDVIKGADMNDPRRPSLIAKEMAEVGEKQKRAYKRQLRKTKKEIVKRNRQKQKDLTRQKVKTKRVSGGSKGAPIKTDSPSPTR